MIFPFIGWLESNISQCKKEARGSITGPFDTLRGLVGWVLRTLIYTVLRKIERVVLCHNGDVLLL